MYIYIYMHRKISQADPGVHWRIQERGPDCGPPKAKFKRKTDFVGSDIKVLRDSRFSLNQSVKSPDD